MHPAGTASTPAETPWRRLTAEERLDRQRQFRAALALAGKSVKSFAEGLNVHENHLYLVMRGDRESRRIDRAVAEFIAQYLEEGEMSVPPMPSV